MTVVAAPEGAKVRVTHLRRVADFSGLAPAGLIKKSGGVPEPKGGATLATVLFPDGSEGRGYARCSDRDNFCRRTGRTIAVGRALKNLLYRSSDTVTSSAPASPTSSASPAPTASAR